jgi:prolyl 4-hydroxylase
MVFLTMLQLRLDADGKTSCSQDGFEISKVWPNGIGYVDTNARVSETAALKRDDVVRNFEQRAASIMGWRNNSTKIERMKVQRYGYNGYYSYHYDWDSLSTRGNRIVTFMVYLVDDCTGGGTNFPRVSRPSNRTWCDIIVCDGDEDDDYPGVTFKPVAGSAIYWENFHPNGTPHRGVRHAGLPVRSGQKVGLNIWAWDSSWRSGDS